MDNRFFARPILNSPYERPAQHWELDEHGQPTQQILATRRKPEFITPIPIRPSARADRLVRFIAISSCRGCRTGAGRRRQFVIPYPQKESANDELAASFVAYDWRMGTYAIDAHTNTHSNADNVSPLEFARSHQGPIKRILSGRLALS
jgi:hypothetical protein